MMTIQDFIRRHPVLTYFFLTFAIGWGSILLIIGGPGMIPGPSEQVERLWPLTMLAWFAGPSVASLLLTGLVDGREGFRQLRSRLLRWRVGAHWYVVALLAGPIFYVGIALALSLLSPEFLPGILTMSDKATLLLFGIAWGLIGGGLLEELGWTGFAVYRLRPKHGALTTAFIVGVMWGAYHVLVIFWMSGSTFSGVSPATFLTVRGLDLLAGGLVAFRVLMVWVYDRTNESLFLAMLMHAMLSTSMLIVMTPATGVPFLAYCLALSAAMWLVVAVIAVTNHRQSLRRGKLSAGIGSPQLTPR